MLVNAQQRMLAVQLNDKKAVKPKADATHVLIKVGTDGRFTVGTTPETKPATAPATAAAAAPPPPPPPAPTTSSF